MALRTLHDGWRLGHVVNDAFRRPLLSILLLLISMIAVKLIRETDEKVSADLPDSLILEERYAKGEIQSYEYLQEK
jgi:uncharacterized membrane protein